jgi:tetratricopeptide (TPR) repeat protein
MDFLLIFVICLFETMVKDIQLVANDLKLYYKGFEVALERGDIDDAIRYLRDMRRELNDNLDYLISKKESTSIQDVMKQNLQESVEDYKRRIKNLEEELRK